MSIYLLFYPCKIQIKTLLFEQFAMFLKINIYIIKINSSYFSELYYIIR